MESNREHFDKLKEVCEGDVGFAAKMFSAGETVEAAKELFSRWQAEKMNQELKMKNRFLAEHNSELRESLLRFSGGDEARAFRSFKALVEQEKIKP